MALSLEELVEKYEASTLTDADLNASGYSRHEVESFAKDSKIGNTNNTTRGIGRYKFFGVSEIYDSDSFTDGIGNNNSSGEIKDL